LGATRLLVSNVLPYTPEMQAEVLYADVLSDITYLSSVWLPQVSLPKMDTNSIAGRVLNQAMGQGWNVSFAGHNLGAASDHCPFIESGSTSIGWDGSLSPCLPLLHSHVGFLDKRRRFVRPYVIGNVAEHSLKDLWLSPEYVAFREKVHAFDFAPCAFCGGCELSYTNEEDCFGNTFPTCGGCLWAQGVIQCP
jgi:MoaA/NifB/PqqE/SkfB family radical SAM enzyme